MIRTILTPIDGSTHAQMALDLSTDLAAKYEAELVALHVAIRDGDVPNELYETALRELEKAEAEGRETDVDSRLSRHLQTLEYMGRMLLQRAREQAEAKGVKRVETIMEFGEAGERILHYAKTHKPADLIVMGSRGYSEIEGLFLGSVSHKVFHLSPCSCVTVHCGDASPAFKGVETVLAPTDGSDRATKAIELASDVAGKYGAKLILVHVMRSTASLEKLRAAVELDKLSQETCDELDPARHAIAEHFGGGFIPPALSKDALKEIGEQILERARRTAEEKGAGAPELMLLDGNPAREIIQTARQKQADLIAMGSRGHGEVGGLLAGSVSYTVNHSAPCSCMIVR